jgi:hypothetical protein
MHVFTLYMHNVTASIAFLPCTACCMRQQRHSGIGQVSRYLNSFCSSVGPLQCHHMPGSFRGQVVAGVC